MELIGLVAMVYEPLCHAREITTIKLSSGCSCKAKSADSETSTERTYKIKRSLHERIHFVALLRRLILRKH